MVHITTNEGTNIEMKNLGTLMASTAKDQYVKQQIVKQAG